MSQSWPRHHVIKVAGHVMDGITASANDLLDCAARLDSRARETISVLVKDYEGNKRDEYTAGALGTARGGQVREDRLRRAEAELAELREEIRRLAGTSPPAQALGDELVGGLPPAARG
ncbi:hypothetical protein [Streptomyces sp. NBC_01477]|uniref:hypothetical protein n=1 Tax=Streptomyces sp. NBC_01477 TaxID=2976015 RepID=UPI002E335E38|nr:hypothetical protein [Streptomyces sp. NBC_01477]